MCWPAWLSHFLSFPFSFSPLSLRGRGATDNTRTTLTSHSTVCQSTLMDARARTRMMPCAHRQMPVSAGQPRDWVHKAEHQGKKPRWQFRGWLPARKETQTLPTSRGATTTAVPAKSYVSNNYWLGLQQTAAAAATSCHRWLLLRRVAVLR